MRSRFLLTPRAARAIAAAALVALGATARSAPPPDSAPAAKVTDRIVAPPRPVQAGVGIVDITPTTLPVALAGPPSRELAKEIDTRLYAKALVLASGNDKLAIVTLDSFKYEAAQADAARRKIAAATGIPFADIVIAASETHRAPFWSAYPDQLATPLAEAVRAAVADLSPATFAAAKSRADGVSENRRVVKDGAVWGRWQLPAPEQNNYPAEGPFDTTFDVLAVIGADGRYKTLVYNFPCKGSNTRAIVVSADFPGDVQTFVQRRLGYAAPLLFLNGPSGDINPVAENRGRPPLPQHAMGDRIGEAIVGALAKLQPIRDPSLKLETVEWQMPARENPEFADADIQRKWPGQYNHFRADYEAQMKVRKASYPYAITGVGLGDDFALVTSPAELFSAYGLAIKQKSPFKYTMVAVDANGSYGYVPTEAAFAGGGYETWFDLGSFLTTRAGRIDESYSVEMLKRMKAAARP